MTAILQNNQNIQLTSLRIIISQSRLLQLLKKSIINQDQHSSAKRTKSKTKPFIFTTQYHPLGPNINSIIKKHLPIISHNPNLVNMFPKDSIFWAYKRVPILKGFMVCTDPYSIKPLKEIDQRNRSNRSWLQWLYE